MSGIICKCQECGERFYFTQMYSELKYAPCPCCDTCAIEVNDRRDPIKSNKTAGDIYDRVDRYNGM